MRKSLYTVICFLLINLPLLGGVDNIIINKTYDVEEPPEIKTKFKTVETPNFVIHSNNDNLRLELSQEIEGIFNEIITDLGFYSVWVNKDKMKIYIFESAEEYHKDSNLPLWSAGYASSIQKSVYLYESGNFNIVFPHELSHLIFGIFMEGKENLINLTWINEGIAVYVEMKNNPDFYRSIDNYMKYLALKSELLDLKTVINIDINSVGDENLVRKWYLEVGSVVRYLVNVKGSMNFYNFCNGLKIFDGDVEKSFNYAYSGAFNTIGELEKAWLEYLKR